MAPIESIVTADHIAGAIGATLVWLALKSIDVFVAKLIDRKVFSEIYSRVKKWIKALLTKRNTISSTFECSVYTPNNVPISKINHVTQDLAKQVADQSKELELVGSPKWDNSQSEAEICYRFRDNKEPYRVKLNFIPEQSQLGEKSEGELPLSSIGVSIEFNFEFGNLRSSIIDLTAFATFLQKTLDDIFVVNSITNARFIVAPIEKDLTMEDWVQEKQFDVSLLLKSENSERSVRFHGDRAEITSPTTEVDDETVEYIRATLLNYYL